MFTILDYFLLVLPFVAVFLVTLELLGWKRAFLVSAALYISALAAAIRG